MQILTGDIFAHSIIVKYFGSCIFYEALILYNPSNVHIVLERVFS